jgi:hypothetical protein
MTNPLDFTGKVALVTGAAADHSDDAHCDSGETRWQACGLAGTRDRRAVRRTLERELVCAWTCHMRAWGPWACSSDITTRWRVGRGTIPRNRRATPRRGRKAALEDPGAAR